MPGDRGEDIGVADDPGDGSVDEDGKPPDAVGGILAEHSSIDASPSIVNAGALITVRTADVRGSDPLASTFVTTSRLVMIPPATSPFRGITRLEMPDATIFSIASWTVASAGIVSTGEDMTSRTVPAGELCLARRKARSLRTSRACFHSCLGTRAVKRSVSLTSPTKLSPSITGRRRTRACVICCAAS